MRYINSLLILCLAAYLAWPYWHLFQLNSAVKSNDATALEKMVDFNKVDEVYKDNLKWKTQNVTQTPSNILPPGAIRDAVQSAAGAIGNVAASVTTIDAKWVLEQMRKKEGSLWDQVTFASFESPTKFMIRLGKLGQNPIHIQLNLQDWVWRVTAVYN